jgi:hypothetical protein
MIRRVGHGIHAKCTSWKQNKVYNINMLSTFLYGKSSQTVTNEHLKGISQIKKKEEQFKLMSTAKITQFALVLFLGNHV